MREVLFRVSWWCTRRAVAIPLALMAACGVALTWAPLLGIPGYELNEALCLLLTFVGPFIAMGTARAGAKTLESALVLLLGVVPALLVAIARTTLGSPCDPFGNFAFAPVLLVPTAFLVAATGQLIARHVRRRWLVVGCWVVAIAASAVATVFPIVAGPQVFAFNHFGGFLPGPLYDEEVSVAGSLLWFRVATLCLALALASSLTRVRIVALLGFFALEWNGTQLGFRASDESVAEALGGELRTDAFVLHYPRGVSDDELAKMKGDLSFRIDQLLTFFGAAPDGKVVVWWYRSPEEKQRLVGAAHTQFAKPWRREVHINSLGYPHPVIKHELVHALAAPWGAQPFGVAATLGWIPHVGVIEGFAVAADNPIDDLTLHEWCAAMKARGLLPDVASLMTPQGFYGAPPSRAYTTSGSFLRWLAETRGTEKLRALYRHGDFHEAFGAELSALATEYGAFLDSVKLDPSAVNQAFTRFRQGSVFDRPCAREVARLSSQTAALLGVDPVRAMVPLRRCRTLQPLEPSHALAEVQLLRRLQRRDDARALLDSELERLNAEPAGWSEAALARADLAIEDGQDDVAKALWTRVVELHVTPPVERTAMIRLSSLELQPSSRRAVQAYFQATLSEESRVLALQDALVADPRSIPLRYLLARRLQQAGEHSRAIELLEPLLAEELPAVIAKETVRLYVESAALSHACAKIDALDTRWGPAFEARARDWLARCEFSQR